MIRIIFNTETGELVDYGIGRVIDTIPSHNSVVYRNTTIEIFQKEIAALKTHAGPHMVRVNGEGVPVAVLLASALSEVTPHLSPLFSSVINLNNKEVRAKWQKQIRLSSPQT